jgi:acetyl esterase/lipase
MKKIIKLLNYVSAFYLLSSIVFSQSRYIDEVFEEIIITENIVYANAPDLPFLFFIESNTFDIDLEMDIYEPEGDLETQRPLIIFLYSGSFFTGSNELDDIVALSKSAAKRGFVVMAINYRLGLNILSGYSGERAVYRGMQDLSAAIRFAREYHEDYNIDPNKIFVWGTSAGGIIALQLSSAEEDERPESTFGIFGDPDLGCIDCEGNAFQHNSKPNAVVSCWGAIGNLEWIDSYNQIPTIMFHGESDLIVPINTGFPFTANITLPLVYGSAEINERMNDLGILHEFYSAEGEGHEYWGTLAGFWTDGPNQYFYDIQSNTYNFLYQFIVNGIQGDINGDEIINIIDVISIVNLIMNSNPYNLIADMNNDNIINILDVLQLVSFILGDN